MTKKPENHSIPYQKGSGYVQMPGEGRIIHLEGVSVVFKADSADTQGAWSLAEYTVLPRTVGPPAHSHESELQAFYVLSGTLAFFLGQRAIRSPAGSFILIPPGVVHTLRNEEDIPATVLLLATPGGIEGYFAELAEMIEHEDNWPPADTSRWRALMERYGRQAYADTD